MQENRQKRGKRGELRAIEALEAAGYSIVERNWYCTLGEIDIVARQGTEIVFVEVRARSEGIDNALESVTRGKQNRLQRLAIEYMNQRELTDAFRIDVAAVDSRTGAVEIIENAAGW